MRRCKNLNYKKIKFSLCSHSNLFVMYKDCYYYIAAYFQWEKHFDRNVENPLTDSRQKENPDSPHGWSGTPKLHVPMGIESVQECCLLSWIVSSAIPPCVLRWFGDRRWPSRATCHLPLEIVQYLLSKISSLIHMKWKDSSMESNELLSTM